MMIKKTLIIMVCITMLTAMCVVIGRAETGVPYVVFIGNNRPAGAPTPGTTLANGLNVAAHEGGYTYTVDITIPGVVDIKAGDVTGPETRANPTIVVVTSDLTVGATLLVQGHKTLISDGTNIHTISRNSSGAYRDSVIRLRANGITFNIGYPGVSRTALRFDNNSASYTGTTVVQPMLQIGDNTAAADMYLNIYTGIFTNSEKSPTKDVNSVITVQRGANLTIDGGTIEDSCATAAGQGGAIHCSEGTVTINSGTIMGNSSAALTDASAITVSGANSFLNIKGGIIKNNQAVKPAIASVSNGNINIGADAALSYNQRISAGKATTVITPLTAAFVATFEGTNGTQVLPSSIGIDNTKFAGYVATHPYNQGYCGINTDGQIDTSMDPPAYILALLPVTPVITLDYNAESKTAAVTSNIAISNAKLIVASYDLFDNLFDVEVIDNFSVDANIPQSEELNGFNTLISGKVKVMLWNGVVPIVKAYNSVSDPESAL